MAQDQTGEIGRLFLAGPCTVRTADDTHARLMEATSRYAVLHIERDDADEVDLSFVQLLLAARCSAHRAGRTVRLARPASGTLLDVLQRGGFLFGQTAADRAFWLQPVSA